MAKRRPTPRPGTHVRVSDSTYVALVAVREQMLRARECGNLDLPLDRCGNVSLDTVVAVLIKDRLDHAARAKKARQRRCEAKRKARLYPPA